MITEMINNFNIYSECYLKHMPIQYGPTKHYNYVGPCLQAGDKFGVCYVFPSTYSTSYAAIWMK